MKYNLTGNLYANTSNYYDYDNREIIKDDLDFYIEYSKLTKGHILELASGTGRVSINLAEKTGRELHCIEFSEFMINKFKNKIEKYRHLNNKIHIYNLDMSNFNLEKKFEYIIIPWRSLQYLPEQEKTIDCLKCIFNHLSENGIFIFDIFNPRTYDENWLGKEEISFDINDGSKHIIRSTINHHFDNTKKYIQYKNKIRVVEYGKETVFEDLLTIKYYEYNDIVGILKSLDFKIIDEFGYYDKRPITGGGGGEMIFVCSK